MSERLGGIVLAHDSAKKIDNLKLIWVDSGYSGPKFETTRLATPRAATRGAQLINAKVEVIKRSKKEFEVLPRRWVVERTFGWLLKNRRLVVDYEQLPEMSEAMIYTAMIPLMLRRLASFSHAS